MRENHYIWFITSSILGVLFIIWGSIAPSALLIPGDIWLIVPGILMVVVGLLGIFDSIITDRILFKYISNLENERISITKLSTDLDIEIPELRELILTLRSRGKLKVFFDEQTGEVVSSILYQGLTCSLCGEPLEKEQFCSVCGTEKPVDESKY